MKLRTILTSIIYLIVSAFIFAYLLFLNKALNWNLYQFLIFLSVSHFVVIGIIAIYLFLTTDIEVAKK